MQFTNVERNARDLQPPLADGEIELLCRTAFGGEARPLSMLRLTSGRFNTVYRIELADCAPVILRVAPPSTARLFRHEALLLQRECAVQPVLAVLGAVIPQVLFKDFSRQVLSRDYVFLNCLDGELWDDVRASLAPAEEADLWAQFGVLVRQIHAIPHDCYGYPQSAGGFSAYSDWFISHVDGLCADLAELSISVATLDDYRRLLDAGRPLFDEAGPPRLVHGDLWLRNILVARGEAGEGLRITGILDAERAFWGEAGAEWIFSFFDLPDEFWAAYGADLRESRLAQNPAALLRRRAYQARGAMQLMLEARRFGFDDGFTQRNFAMAVAGMRRIMQKA